MHCRTAPYHALHEPSSPSSSCTTAASAGHPNPAAAKTNMFVARQIAVALARVRNIGSGGRSVLHSRLLARGLLLLGSRRPLGLLAACALCGPSWMGEREGGTAKSWEEKKRKGG